MLVFPHPQYKACGECGACYPRWDDEHVCDQERWLDYQLVRLRPDVAKFFKADWPAWLASLAGQFEVMYAERTRQWPS